MKKKSGAPYQCWVCKEEFDRYVELKQHIRTGHLGEGITRMSYETEIKPKLNIKKDKSK